MCKQIDHFPEDADYQADASEYFLRKSNVCVCVYDEECARERERG